MPLLMQGVGQQYCVPGHGCILLRPAQLLQQQQQQQQQQGANQLSGAGASKTCLSHLIRD
jgi:hypothetical protein